MKKINFDCDEILALEIMKYIAKIYFYIQGSTEGQFKNLCCEGMKKIINYDSLEWVVEPELFIPDKNSSHHITISNAQMSTDTHILTVKKNEIDAPLNLIDNHVLHFIFPHLIDAYYQNKKLILKNSNRLENCYSAICDSQLNIVEGEINFFKLLNDNFGDSWNKIQLPIINMNIVNNKIIFNGVCFKLTKLESLFYVNAYYYDERFNKLTISERNITILMLNKTKETEILSNLRITKKTLNNHLFKIYKKFGVAGKKELLPSILGSI